LGFRAREEEKAVRMEEELGEEKKRGDVERKERGMPWHRCFIGRIVGGETGVTESWGGLLSLTSMTYTHISNTLETRYRSDGELGRTVVFDLHDIHTH
jgi:hypothetical protein